MNEISVNVQQQNGTVSFNFNEIKERLTAEMSLYKGIVFTESTKKEAKETVAELRKLKKAVDDKRKQVKTSFMQPYTDFETKVKELNTLIDEPILFIGKQVDEFERKRIEERKALIREIYESQIADFREFLPLEKIYNNKWENTTTTKKAITEEIAARISDVKKDIETINDMGSEFEDKGIAVYMRTLELSEAIRCMNNYEKQKSEILARQVQKEKRLADVEEAKECITVIRETPEDIVKQIPKEKSAVYEIIADPFQIAQLEASMHELGITYRRVQ